MTDNEQVDAKEVLEYCNRATPGPWCGEAESANDDTGVFFEARVLVRGDGSYAHQDKTIATIRCGLAETDANWHMITRARTDLPLLARRVLELEQELNVARTLLKVAVYDPLEPSDSWMERVRNFLGDTQPK